MQGPHYSQLTRCPSQDEDAEALAAEALASLDTGRAPDVRDPSSHAGRTLPAGAAAASGHMTAAGAAVQRQPEHQHRSEQMQHLGQRLRHLDTLPVATTSGLSGNGRHQVVYHRRVQDEDMVEQHDIGQQRFARDEEEEEEGDEDVHCAVQNRRHQAYWQQKQQQQHEQQQQQHRWQHTHLNLEQPPFYQQQQQQQPVLRKGICLQGRWGSGAGHGDAPWSWRGAASVDGGEGCEEGETGRQTAGRDRAHLQLSDKGHGFPAQNLEREANDRRAQDDQSSRWQQHGIRKQHPQLLLNRRAEPTDGSRGSPQRWYEQEQQQRQKGHWEQRNDMVEGLPARPGSSEGAAAVATAAGPASNAIGCSRRGSLEDAAPAAEHAYAKEGHAGAKLATAASGCVGKLKKPLADEEEEDEAGVSSPEHLAAAVGCPLQGAREGILSTPCSLTTSRKRLSRGSAQQQQHGLACVLSKTDGVPAEGGGDGSGGEHESPPQTPTAAAAASKAAELQGGCSDHTQQKQPGSSEPGSGGRSSAGTGGQQSDATPGSGRGRCEAEPAEQPSSSEVLLVPQLHSQQQQYGQEGFARPGTDARRVSGTMEMDSQERRRRSTSARGVGDGSGGDPLHIPDETTPEGKGTAPGLNFSTPYPLLYRHHSQGDPNEAAAAAAAAGPRASSQGGGSPDDPGALAAAFQQAEAGGLGHGGISPRAQLLDVLEASAANLNQGSERMELSDGGSLGVGGLNGHDCGRSGCSGCEPGGPGGGLLLRHGPGAGSAPSSRRAAAAAGAAASGAGTATGECPKSKEIDAAAGGEHGGGDWADMLVGDQSMSKSQEGEEEAAPGAKSGSSNALNEQSLGTAGPHVSSSRGTKSIGEPSVSLRQHIADLVPEDMSNLLLTCCLGSSAALPTTSSSSEYAAGTCVGTHQPSSNGTGASGEGQQQQGEELPQQQKGAFLTPQKGAAPAASKRSPGG